MLRGGPASLQRQYDDFTLSSADERSEDDDNQHDDDGEQSAFYKGDQRFPLKSTLPTHFKRSPTAPFSSRHASLPRAWNADAKASDRVMNLGNGIGRQIGHADNNGDNHVDDDVTLSTDQGTAAEEYFDAQRAEKRPTTVYEDDSFIPGVGRGVHRGNTNGGASYSAHRDLLASSHFAVHPSPSTAARHEQIRASASNNRVKQQRPSSASSTLSSDAGEDSESDNETSSTSTTSHALQPLGMLQSKADSTGNHQTLDKSRDDLYVPQRHERPRLDARALDEMDRAIKKGRSLMRQDVPHSPSPVSSRQGTPQVLRSKKEDHRKQHRGSPTMHAKGRKEGAEGAVQAEGSGRKPSDSSSNGRKQAGTTGSTTGETLVEEDRDRGSSHYLQRGGGNGGEKSPFFKLPSGQKMGQSTVPGSHLFLPDLTGMTSALESPVKAILGVEHRQMMPQAVQARHLQLNETRLDDFNELAHYVKTVERELDQTQRKVQAVEAKSTKCVKEMNALRNEWTSFQGLKSKRKSVGTQKEILAPEESEEEEEDGGGREYESKLAAINDHIAHLTRDLHSYRETMEQMRAAKEQAERAREKKLAEKQKRLQEKRNKIPSSNRGMPIRSSSPMKQALSDDEDVQEEARSEMVMLRRQVSKVAKEVERLRMIVDAEGNRPSAAQEKSTRFTPAVKPDLRRSIGVGSSQSPFRKSIQRGPELTRFGSSVGRAAAAPMLRSSSPVMPVHAFNREVEDEEEEDMDETVRPFSEQVPPTIVDHDDDLSFVAHARAERVFEKVDEHGRHDEKDCTVCRGKEKSQKRRLARKERAHQQALQFTADKNCANIDDDEDKEESLFLSLLDAALSEDHQLQQDAAFKALPTKSSKHEKIIRRLLKEHMDEFYHHRMLYCELADELKEFSPDLNRIKRKILAEHVMESVEGLEYRATRINILQALIGQGDCAAPEGKKHTREKGRSRNSSGLRPGDHHRGEPNRRVASA